MQLMLSRFLLIPSLLCFLAIVETGCAPVLSYVLDIAVDAGITLCTTKGGEFIDKEFDNLMDQFMGKAGTPKHKKSEAAEANDQHPALLLDQHNPNRATALGFTTIHYGGKHGVQGCAAVIEDAHFIKQNGHWTLDPNEKAKAIAKLTESLE